MKSAGILGPYVMVGHSLGAYETFPRADILHLADQANMPYGNRTGPDIVSLTRAGCERLSARGCELIILACNTAAAVALRSIQQGWLPDHHDHRRSLGRTVNVLGIIVPTIEMVTGKPWNWTLGVTAIAAAIALFVAWWVSGERSKRSVPLRAPSSDSEQMSEAPYERRYEQHASENETGCLALDRARNDGNGYQSSGQTQQVVDYAKVRRCPVPPRSATK